LLSSSYLIEEQQQQEASWLLVLVAANLQLLISPAPWHAGDDDDAEGYACDCELHAAAAPDAFVPHSDHNFGVQTCAHSVPPALLSSLYNSFPYSHAREEKIPSPSPVPTTPVCSQILTRGMKPSKPL
jgi:hypothetical protein